MADNLTKLMCRISWNLGSSTPWNPESLSRPLQGLLFFIFINNNNSDLLFKLQIHFHWFIKFIRKVEDEWLLGLRILFSDLVQTFQGIPRFILLIPGTQCGSNSKCFTIAFKFPWSLTATFLATLHAKRSAEGIVIRVYIRNTFTFLT
jgi:hypothetical protein